MYNKPSTILHLGTKGHSLRGIMTSTRGSYFNFYLFKIHFGNYFILSLISSGLLGERPGSSPKTSSTTSTANGVLALPPPRDVSSPQSCSWYMFHAPFCSLKPQRHSHRPKTANIISSGIGALTPPQPGKKAPRPTGTLSTTQTILQEL